ncbi:c-type cytochrome [Limobrevibacterium gyesilva]|uniref:C-type cytochrome n=1 Tax=Limobrevibacterium gyesilva TaxID=2991712 RepID=A0AA41YQ24_9PROT|nr:c-type cytochrome [Limobrevibacterium gyesilva]MCW3474400.1 c-type cytochrome [Limobrevibacterium gyesilva]
MGRIAPLLIAGAIAAAPLTNVRAQFTVPMQATQPDPATLFTNQCGTCHSVKPGDMPRQGPNLFGVFGRKAGSFPGFRYSPGFAQAGFVWDEPHLDAYLTNPQAVIKGGVMAYRQANPETRNTIIAWLREQH